MSHITYVTLQRYLPEGVKRIIAKGGDCWIGEVDDSAVLKYSHFREDQRTIQIEAKMFQALGPHPHIIQSKGLTPDGLLLEYAPNGTLHTYLTSHPKVSQQQRLTWCIQATEALVHAHSKRVLHCDLRHDNFLLDANLDIKLADFQGQHFSPKGQVILDGLSLESTKAYLPRKPTDHATIRTDLFALAGVIYFIMMGHEVYPELDHARDEEEIERRFRAKEFPQDEHVCVSITSKCWNQVYFSAQEVLSDLEALQGGCLSGGNIFVQAESDGAASGSSWLNGLCDDAEAPKAPPPYRQLVGFD